jgi:hypothetical protein
LPTETRTAEAVPATEATVPPMPPPPTPTCKEPSSAELLREAEAFWRKRDPKATEIPGLVLEIRDRPEFAAALARVVLPSIEDIDNRFDDEDKPPSWCVALEEDVFDTHPSEPGEVPSDVPATKHGCVRRALLLELVPYLTACDLLAIEAQFAQLLAVPEPEHELPAALLDQARRLEIEDWALDLLLANEDATIDTRIWALERLSKIRGPRATATLERIARLPESCMTAHLASRALAARGAKQYLAKNRLAGTPPEIMLALCMSAAANRDSDEGGRPHHALWREVIAEDGYQAITDCSHFESPDRSDFESDEAFEEASATFEDMVGSCTDSQVRSTKVPGHHFGDEVDCQGSGHRYRCLADRPFVSSGVAGRFTSRNFVFERQPDGPFRLVKMVTRPAVTEDSTVALAGVMKDARLKD